jgi:hypothetical protein
MWKGGNWGKELRSLLLTVLKWRFSDATREMGEKARHFEVISHGLQMMAIEESLLKHRDEWTLVERVFKWLGDFAVDQPVLATMSTELRQLHVAKARLFSITNGQIVSVGIRGLLT